MSSYYDDHNIVEPKKDSKNNSASHPNVDDFMNLQGITRSSDQDLLETMMGFISFLDHLRGSQRISTNGTHQATLDALISQLLEEANANAKGPPPASKFFISNLPSVETIAQDATCSICVEIFESASKNVKKLPCNHLFHSKCIIPWLEIHNTCPICRREFPTDDPEYEKQRKAKNAASGNRNLEEDEEEDADFMYG